MKPSPAVKDAHGPKLIENKSEAESDKKALDAAVQKEKDARGKKATNEIQAILDKYHCVLIGVPAFIPKGGAEFSVTTRVQVVVK